MSSEKEHEKTPSWKSLVEKFEEIVVAALALLLVMLVAIILAVVAYLFVVKVGAVVCVAVRSGYAIATSILTDPLNMYRLAFIHLREVGCHGRSRFGYQAVG
jgi:uncharacterized membrane protein (DUF485 family)